MATRWPDNIPFEMEVGITEAPITDGVLVIPMTSGKDKQILTKEPYYNSRYGITLVLTDEEHLQFEKFYNEVLNRGTKPFVFGSVKSVEESLTTSGYTYTYSNNDYLSAFMMRIDYRLPYAFGSNVFFTTQEIQDYNLDDIIITDTNDIVAFYVTFEGFILIQPGDFADLHITNTGAQEANTYRRQVIKVAYDRDKNYTILIFSMLPDYQEGLRGLVANNNNNNYEERYGPTQVASGKAVTTLSKTTTRQRQIPEGLPYTENNIFELCQFDLSQPVTAVEDGVGYKRVSFRLYVKERLESAVINEWTAATGWGLSDVESAIAKLEQATYAVQGWTGVTMMAVDNKLQDAINAVNNAKEEANANI